MKVSIKRPFGKSLLQRKVEANGYLWDEAADMPAHRAVAERVLGRQLKHEEIVHHCNHDKQNNSEENLFVVSAIVHDVIHVFTIISAYGRPYPAGLALYDPLELKKFLSELGVQYIWLKEAQDDKSTNRH